VYQQLSALWDVVVADPTIKIKIIKERKKKGKKNHMTVWHSTFLERRYFHKHAYNRF